MKKILFIIYIIIFCFICTSNVHANVAGPFTFFGDVIVDNPEGAKINEILGELGYDNSDYDIIPYGEILKPFDSFGNSVNVKWNDIFFNIFWKDLKPLDEYYRPKEDDLKGHLNKMIVIDEGAKLLKGPALCFDILDYVEIGTILEYRFAKNHWIYTNYNGQDGWVYMFDVQDDRITNNQRVVAFEINRKGYILDSNINNENYRHLENDETIPVTIKYGTVNTFSLPSEYYIETEELEGWVLEEDLLIENKGDISIYVTDNKLDLYQDMMCTELIDTINCDQLFDPIYFKTNYNKLFYIEYENGKKAFIKGGKNIALHYNNPEVIRDTMYSNNNCYLYSEPTNTENKIIDKIPPNYCISDYYSTSLLLNSYFGEWDLEYDYHWFYIDDGKYKGWINDSDLSSSRVEEEVSEGKANGKNENIDDKGPENTIENQRRTNQLCNIDIGFLFMLIIITCFYFYKKKTKGLTKKER